MIVAVGIDVVEIDRIARAMEDPRFLERILTPTERATIRDPLRVAGRWAAKEALAKCVPGLTSWQDVSILNNSAGAPFVQISEKLLDSSQFVVHISISHEKGVAAAVAILESRGPFS